MTTTSIAVAYHSGFGHTRVLAEAVVRGITSGGAEAHLLAVDSLTDADWSTLDAADAIVFGAPTYMGGASAGFHTFAEQTSKRYLEGRWQDKLAAGFTNSGSKSGDKSNTLAFLSAFAYQHQMIWVSLGLMPGWNFTTSSEHDLNRLGFWTGAAAQTHNDSPAEDVHASDVATAEHLGRRVAGQARVVVAGRGVLAGSTR
ncbi:flavodoxin family protein [Amycolatopsis dongchuanensis]|uniref:Flavodoxin family protein n=1 Tax=Amycolatopsis dongchuanensis TaxID=1070866 RepID=A0ABP9PSZ0_9PSEU